MSKPETHQHSFFRPRQKLLGILCAIYVAGLFVFHAQVPPHYVWITAAVFSIAMNFTYLTEACSLGLRIGAEAAIAIVLITMAILGAIYAPLLVIASIFAHGMWDLAKHYGAGVPFLRWYTCGCAVVDTAYSAALLWYWLQLA